MSESNPDCRHPSLITTLDGLHCPDCGYQWQAPYFLRTVIRKWDAAERIEEEKRAKKLAKKASVTIAPSVAAHFTDDAAVVGKVWTCEKCRRGPRKHPDFANNWRWKTEAGFLKHKCVG